jgi:hypothetical protein
VVLSSVYKTNRTIFEKFQGDFKLSLDTSSSMVALKTLFVLLSALLVADATQVMHRPDNYKVAPKKFAMEAHPKIHTITRRAASGYVCE